MRSQGSPNKPTILCVRFSIVAKHPVGHGDASSPVTVLNAVT